MPAVMKNAEIVELCCAEIASFVIAFANDDVKAMIVPAVCKPLIKVRAIVPKKAPIRISPIKSNDELTTLEGITGNVEIRGGEATKLTAKAIANENRGDTKDELNPGIIEMAEPMRAKIRKNPKILSSKRSLNIPATRD